MNKDNKEVETIKETPQQSDQKVEKTNETQLKEKKEDPISTFNKIMTKLKGILN